MSEQEERESDYTTDESNDETNCDEKKALPWHSTDLVKRDPLSDDDKSSSGSSTNSSTKKKNKHGPNGRKPFLDQSIAVDMDKHLKITPGGKSSSKKSSTTELEIQKQISQDFEDVEMKDPPTEINILLLGESGVGKSTFINSFANYMKHENFEAVQENLLSVLIPAEFSIFDKEFKSHDIKIGAKDENEYLAAGAAATQDVKTYVFYITLERKSYLIRLIDTPGIGDPRGIDRDNQNCDYILNYLGRLEKIHAICLLLKPTNTRLDVFLNYCITQILSRLEKSATDNIAFLFTNTRGQNYTPGDTYRSLEVLVKSIKDSNNVTLPLGYKNVFCFDNEAFRFLASIKQGVEFREGILEANIESWKYSYKEVYRLLSYIVKLKPHDPQKTVSINHARKMVLQLAQPLAEIVQLIGDNIYKLEEHTHQLLMENQTVDELKQKLYMPVIDIRAKELDQPVTVCTAPQCSTVYKVADKNKFHYKQRCHNPCHLNNVPREIVGDPHILDCWAINKSTQSCHQCGCRFNTHMHIYYETDTFETKIVDQNIQQNILSKEDAAREKEIVMDKILNHKEALEKEHKYIIKCSASFAHFLQQNAITPINDSLKEYVKYLIKREETLGPEANNTTLDYLRRLLSEYEQEKNVLEEALKHDTRGIVNTSANAIESKIKELFTLPNFGKKIKQLYDLHQSGGLREHKQSEYVVKERYNLSIMERVKTAVKGVFGLDKSKKQHRLEFEQQRAIALERFEREFYGNELQRHTRDPSLQSNFEFNRQYFDPHFGPHGSRNPYDFDRYYGWEESERQQRPYQLHSGGNDGEAYFNSISAPYYQGTSFQENGKDEANKKQNRKALSDSSSSFFSNDYANSGKHKGVDNRQVVKHVGKAYNMESEFYFGNNKQGAKMTVQSTKVTDLSIKDKNGKKQKQLEVSQADIEKPKALKGNYNKFKELELSSGSEWKSISDDDTTQTGGRNGKKNNKANKNKKSKNKK